MIMENSDSRGIRNNNPFNIIRSKSNWIGLVSSSSEKKFCVFSDMDLGLRAGIILLKNYVLLKGLTTVSDILSRFAPPAENGIVVFRNYVEYVTKVVGSESIDLRDESFYRLCRAVVWFESYYNLRFIDFIRIVSKYDIYDGVDSYYLSKQNLLDFK